MRRTLDRDIVVDAVESDKSYTRLVVRSQFSSTKQLPSVVYGQIVVEILTEVV